MSQSLKHEAQRINWRLSILKGKYGSEALKRIIAMVEHGLPEKLIT